MMNKKIICLVLSIVMLTSFSLTALAGDYTNGRQKIFINYDHRYPNEYDKGWVDSGFKFTTDGTMTPFRPEADYVSEQNPPDFMWPLNIEAKSYDLIVCSDPQLKKVVYKKENLSTNFYNFEHIFETGVNYWWAVRFKKTGGATSGWSDARRFRIQPDAHEFVVPDIETILERIPKDHPRIYTTKENLEAYRALSDTGNTAVSNIKKTYIDLAEARLMTNIEEVVPEDIPMPTEEEKKDVEWNQNLRAKALQGYSQIINLSYAYLLTGEERYARRAIDEMLRVSKWAPDGATGYSTQDQIHREIMLHLAMAIDWCWDVATEEERNIVIDHILVRMSWMEYLLDSIPITPYDSHGWTAYGFIGIAGIALYGETEKAESWLKAIIPAYAAFLPPWGNQDGGWSQGTGYWQFSSQTNRDIMDVLADADIIDLYGKAWQENEYLWIMYATPAGSYGSFGDETNISKTFGTYVPELAGGIAHRSNDEEVSKVARWLAQQYLPGNDMQLYASNSTLNGEVHIPYDYPLSHEFNDIGWVVMTDDLVSQDRIQMTFKSSHWGSFNHSHPDQNAFTIQAYGQKLASRGGYYDAYHTVHDSGFTRKTGAHNTVTVTTNKGQKDDSMQAKGELTAYLNHADFDLVTGDATPAYEEQSTLDYFERHMIYIRPDIFVVIDDLDSYGEKEDKFEWWLNTDTDIEIYEGGVTGCRNKSGIAVLDTQVHYPQKVTTYYNNIHALSDMIEIPPSASSKFSTANVQRRVWFETEPVDTTKMIVTLDVHKTDSDARSIDTQYGEGYVKMTFEDGTVLIANINTDETQELTVGNITFKGAAVVYNDESIMLVSGTSLKEGGVELICSEKLCSVVMGKNEISLSTYEDNTISIHNDNDYVKGIAEVRNENSHLMGPEWGITINEETKLIATAATKKKGNQNTASKKTSTKTTDDEETELTYSVEQAEGYTTFECEADNYTLVTNGKSIKSAEMKGTVKIIIDGVETINTEITGYTKRDGSVKYVSNIDLPAAKYLIEKIGVGTTLGGHVKGDAVVMTSVELSSPYEENVIELTTIPSYTVKLKETNGDQDADTLKSKLTIFKEAEDAIKLAPSAKVYTTRSWLSGGEGVQLHDQPGEETKYAINVEEAGYYDIAVKYVAWDSDSAARTFTIDGKAYIILLPRTIDWGTLPENWKYVVGDVGVYLEPGEYELSIEPIEGMWNYDYLGLIKRD